MNKILNKSGVRNHFNKRRITKINKMKKLTFSIATLGLLALMSCGQSTEQKASEEKHKVDSIATATKQQKDSVKQAGQTSNSGWICPDNVKMFPPVDIKSWNKVPVVNGRIPTREETQNGTSLIYINKFETPDAKPYDMTLPKLASFFSSYTKKEETVIVIQIVQTAKDTVVGYRFLTGGNGTNDFRDFHFLTDNEINKAVGNTL
jgi:hypothetical protein